MKKFTSIALVVMLVCFLAVPAFAGTGNGIPSGQHFLLNVIGFDNCPGGDFTDSNRHMIAVKASYAYDPSGVVKSDTVKTNTIGLLPGADFAVTDGNACNRGGAEFMLPSDVATKYQVYVRLVGKPGTGIDVTTCADEAIDVDGDGIIEDIVMCSTESVVETRYSGKTSPDGTGKPITRNVTSELLTICLDTSGDGVCDVRYNLFDPALEDYFWQWNTTGKAHAQLIFVPVVN
ncbi:MAG: hypothetical protein WAV13_09850 [Thermodesulfovibrionales bacterium]